MTADAFIKRHILATKTKLCSGLRAMVKHDDHAMTWYDQGDSYSPWYDHGKIGDATVRTKYQIRTRDRFRPKKNLAQNYNYHKLVVISSVYKISDNCNSSSRLSPIRSGNEYEPKYYTGALIFYLSKFWHFAMP